MATLTSDGLMREITDARNTTVGAELPDSRNALSAATTLSEALDSYNDLRVSGAPIGGQSVTSTPYDTSLVSLRDQYYQRGLTDTWTTSSTQTTTGLTIAIEHVDGTKTSVNVEDMYKDLEDQKQKNEELEARLFKLEEHMRFLKEI